MSEKRFKDSWASFSQPPIFCQLRFLTRGVKYIFFQINFKFYCYQLLQKMKDLQRLQWYIDSRCQIYKWNISECAVEGKNVTRSFSIELKSSRGNLQLFCLFFLSFVYFAANLRRWRVWSMTRLSFKHYKFILVLA